MKSLVLVFLIIVLAGGNLMLAGELISAYSLLRKAEIDVNVCGVQLDTDIQRFEDISRSLGNAK